MAALLTIPAISATFHENPDDTINSVIIQDAVRTLYESTTFIVYETSDEAFENAFPNYDLYLVIEPTRLPPVTHLMAWDPTTETAYDTTRDFPEMMADSNALLLEKKDALTYALAFASVGNTELELAKVPVTSQDSEELGTTVRDPQATGRALDGWNVTLTTWFHHNGFMTDWSLGFTTSEIVDANWVVEESAVGPFAHTAESTNFKVGMEFLNHWSTTGGHTLRAYQATEAGAEQLLLPSDVETLDWRQIPNTTRQNHDGSTWVAYYPSVEPDTPSSIAELGKALTGAGVHVYDEQVARNPTGCAGSENPNANWGFESSDPDCQLGIHVLNYRSLLCIICVYAGDDVKIYVDPGLQQTLNGLGLYLNSTVHDINSIGRALVSHEHFHNLQFGITEWDPFWRVYLEGQASLAQSLIEPLGEHQPSSPTTTDANLHQKEPADIFCKGQHSANLLWGHFYSEDGGMSAIRGTLEELAEAPGIDCHEEIRGAIDNQTGAASDGHADFANLLTDFSLRVYMKDFPRTAPTETASRNWGLHLEDVHREVQQVDTTAEWEVGAFAANYVQLPGSGVYAVTCSARDSWEFRVLYRGTDGTVTIDYIDCGIEGVLVEAALHKEVLFNAIRMEPWPDSYDLTLKSS